MNAKWEVDQELADTMATENRRRKRQQQCRAKISDHALSMRQRHSPTDRRCRRAATIDGYCYQHAPLQAEHERIVARIMEIPPRD